MALNIFDTASLNQVVDNLKRPGAALLNRVFGTIVEHTTKKIYFDVEVGKRRIAPYVHPTSQGKIVESLGYTTNDFEPAYIKDKRVFDPDTPLERTIGESIGGSRTPGDRTNANLAKELADQSNMLTHVQEVQASEVLRTGKITITGVGYPSVVVDFGRTAGHTVTLTGANRWGQAGIVPIDNINTWSATMLQNSGAPLTTVIMDPAAWLLFTAETKTKDLLDTRRGSMSRAEIALYARIGLQYAGTIGIVDYFVYQDWYVDSAGTEQPMLPANTVLLLSEGNVMGKRNYGVIRDYHANHQAREMFAKSWLEQDPSARILMMQSAPLLVPMRPDATFCATVN